MFKNALWINPVGWSKCVVGTKFNFCLWIFVQVFFTACLIFILSDTLDFDKIIGVCVLVVGGTAFFPIMYIYALRQVLKELRKEKSLTAKIEG